jgi:hypothetical protein
MTQRRERTARGRAAEPVTWLQTMRAAANADRGGPPMAEWVDDNADALRAGIDRYDAMGEDRKADRLRAVLAEQGYDLSPMGDNS